VASCDLHYADCDGVHSNGCEVDLGEATRTVNTCATATTLSKTICGDDGADEATASNRGSRWFKVKVDECSNWDVNLNVAVSMAANQGGTDYDIEVAEGSCTASLDGKGACNWDCVDDDWSDDWAQNDDKWIYIKVFHVSGNACTNYTLRAAGNKFCACN
jgi:hypothetical protein